MGAAGVVGSGAGVLGATGATLVAGAGFGSAAVEVGG